MPAIALRPDTDARELALCAVDAIADQIHSECFNATAFSTGPFARWTQIDNAVRLIKADYLNADQFSTPDLLALALGLTANSHVRVAAMDALAKRCGVPE